MRMVGRGDRWAVKDTHSDEVYDVISVVDILFDVDCERGAHHGLEKEDGILGIAGRRGCILAVGASGRAGWCHGSWPGLVLM